MMGMGEPLANLDRVLAALDVARSRTGSASAPGGSRSAQLDFRRRLIDLAKSGVPYNLAVSLHAPNDHLRSELVPVNKKIGIERSSTRRIATLIPAVGG